MNQHWSHPEHVSRKRAASTQLSTLPSQHSQKSLPEEDDGEEEGSSDEDDTDEELESEVGRTGKRRKTRKLAYMVVGSEADDTQARLHLVEPLKGPKYRTSITDRLASPVTKEMNLS
jgi:hypothetical protein